MEAELIFAKRSQWGPWENGWSGGGGAGAWGHLRTLPTATESVELISDTVWGGETGEVDEVPDGLYSVFRSSDLSERGRPGPMTQLLPTIWSWCVWVFAPRLINHITYVAGYASLFVCFDARQGHRWTIFLRSLGALSQSITNWRGITAHVFLSRRGELCMIVYMSPLRSNSTFFLYSQTILLEKKLSSYQLLLLSSKSEVNQNQARHKISNLTSSRNSKLGEHRSV